MCLLTERGFTLLLLTTIAIIVAPAAGQQKPSWWSDSVDYTYKYDDAVSPSVTTISFGGLSNKFDFDALLAKHGFEHSYSHYRYPGEGARLPAGSEGASFLAAGNVDGFIQKRLDRPLGSGPDFGWGQRDEGTGSLEIKYGSSIQATSDLRTADERDRMSYISVGEVQQDATTLAEKIWTGSFTSGQTLRIGEISGACRIFYIKITYPQQQKQPSQPPYSPFFAPRTASLEHPFTLETNYGLPQFSSKEKKHAALVTSHMPAMTLGLRRRRTASCYFDRPMTKMTTAQLPSRPKISGTDISLIKSNCAGNCHKDSDAVKELRRVYLPTIETDTREHAEVTFQQPEGVYAPQEGVSRPYYKPF